MTEWISVKDRLPDEGTWYVAITSRREKDWMDNREVAVTHASARYMNSPVAVMTSEWTHWMPAPSPPVVVNEETT